jgi:hypothetical protein
MCNKQDSCTEEDYNWYSNDLDEKESREEESTEKESSDKQSTETEKESSEEQSSDRDEESSGEESIAAKLSAVTFTIEDELYDLKNPTMGSTLPTGSSAVDYG